LTSGNASSTSPSTWTTPRRGGSGDLLREGEARFGEKAFQAVQALTGWKAKRLQNARWVSAAVAPRQRNENLSWSHHRSVASLDDPRDMKKWLDLAEANDWGAVELQKRIQAAGALEPPPAPSTNHDLKSAREALKEVMAEHPDTAGVVTSALLILDQNPPEHRCGKCGMEW
jgi:hypothetical protein